MAAVTDVSAQTADLGHPRLCFTFPSVNQACLRTSCTPDGPVAGMRRDAVVFRAGGRPVYADRYDGHHPPGAVRSVALQDDGRQAVVTCQGVADSGFTRQTLEPDRPGCVILTRHTDADQAWCCGGTPVRDGNTLRWEDGTVLDVAQGTVVSLDPEGNHDRKIVGMGRLRLKDPLPTAYPLVTARPQDGRLVVAVRLPGN